MLQNDQGSGDKEAERDPRLPKLALKLFIRQFLALPKRVYLIARLYSRRHGKTLLCIPMQGVKRAERIRAANKRLLSSFVHRLRNPIQLTCITKQLRIGAEPVGLS